jgi:hypothetical protein
VTATCSACRKHGHAADAHRDPALALDVARDLLRRKELLAALHWIKLSALRVARELQRRAGAK